MADWIDTLIEREELPAGYRAIVENEWTALATRIAREAASRKPLVVGINGAQGTGKSTMASFLEVLLAKRGLRAVTLSMDDIYLTRSERQQLASEIHPLFATRGVPGTHSPALAMDVIEHIVAGRGFTLPRFDKARDDRLEEGERITGPVDVLLFDGWCMGARPQDDAALAVPVNTLEAEEDADGTWRRLVNQWLANDYAELFGQIDLLVMLKVEDFDAVRRNRALQESKLRKRRPDAPGLMNHAQLRRFQDHYERLTLHMLDEMPDRADVLIEIDAAQRPTIKRGA